jgi:hypothetical protein
MDQNHSLTHMIRKRSNSCPEFIYHDKPHNKITFSSEGRIPPTKGRIALENKFYHFNRRYENNYYYKCADKSCKGRLTLNGTEMLYEISKPHTCSTNNAERPLEQFASETELQLFIQENVEYHSTILSLTPEMIYETLLTSLAKKYMNHLYRIPMKNEILAMIRKLR